MSIMTETPNAPRADRNALDRKLGPETILPGQFADLARGAAAILPEHRLMLAVLEDAIRCYQMTLNAGGRRSWRRFRETEAWFASDDATWLFSFATICEALDLDPAYIRAGLRAWCRREARQRPGVSLEPLRIRRVNGLRHQITAPALGVHRHA
jgi:hypothetical protein